MRHEKCPVSRFSCLVSNVSLSRQRGVIGLLTILILSSVIMTVGLAAAHVSQTQIIMSGEVDREQTVRTALSACVEEALFRLRRDAAYVGGTVPVNAGTQCVVGVSGAGSTRTLVITGTDGAQTLTVSVEASLRQNVSGKASGWAVSRWRETGP